MELASAAVKFRRQAAAPCSAITERVRIHGSDSVQLLRRGPVGSVSARWSSHGSAGRSLWHDQLGALRAHHMRNNLALRPTQSGAYQLETLHIFRGPDGFEPSSSMIIGAGNVLFGTTPLGGNVQGSRNRLCVAAVDGAPQICDAEDEVRDNPGEARGAGCAPGRRVVPAPRGARRRSARTGPGLPPDSL